MKTLFILMLSLCIITVNFAQDSLKTVKKIKISEVGMHLNLFTAGENYSEFSDFYKLAPKSILLKNDFSNYQHGANGIFSTINSSPILSVFTSLKFANKQKNAYKENIRLRAGITLFNQQVTGYISNQTINSYDVLTSGSTGNTVVLDSVISRSYYVSYTSKQLRLDVSLLFSTNQQKRRMAFYTGLGISAGMSFKNNTNINYSTYSRIRINGQEQYGLNQSNSSTGTSEDYNNKSDYGVAVYVPLGVDLLLGRKRQFWRNAHLFYEIKPCYNALIVPDVRTYSYIGILHGWGLRFNL